MRTLALCLAVLAGVSSCALLKPIKLLNLATPNTGFTRESDIAYGDHKRQTLDLYRPTNLKPDSPLLVFVYGGAWRQGEKSEYAFVAQAFAAEGYRVVIPNYRLYPSVLYPEIIDDVYDAVVFLRLNAARFDIPDDKIVLMGHSSGAHAAALLASSPRYFAESSFITALVGLAGPYDLPLDNPEVGSVFRSIGKPSSVKPVALVTSRHPRTLLLHGVKDKRVKPFHSSRYEQALRDSGVEVENHLLKGVGHVGIVASVATPLRLLNSSKQLMSEFLASLDAN